MISRNKLHLKLISKTLFLLMTAALTACSGSIEEFANSTLYGFKTANKTSIPDAPDGFNNFKLNISVTDQDLSIHGWSHYRSSKKPTIIYLHGNASNLGGLAKSNLLGFMKDELDVNVVAIDYPSYGNSVGKPNQESLVASAGSTIEWVKRMYPRSKIIVWGRSLGTGPTSQVANLYEGKIHGFVLTSPWNSIDKLIDVHFKSLKSQVPQSWFDANKYDSKASLQSVSLPGVIHHGDKDKLIPHSLGKDIYDNMDDQSNVRFVTLTEKEHNDVFNDARLWNSVKELIKYIK